MCGNWRVRIFRPKSELNFADLHSSLSGLGLATTNLGAHVAILDLDDPTGVFKQLGSQVRFFKVDVFNKQQIESPVKESPARGRNFRGYRSCCVLCWYSWSGKGRPRTCEPTAD
jgi:hypothetical protein